MVGETLEHAHEPPLEQRLFEVFKALPLGLDEKRLRAFCHACAKLRNDISYFGGERHDASYSEFLKDANTKAKRSRSSTMPCCCMRQASMPRY